MTWQSLRDRAVSLTAQVRSRVRFAAIGRGLVAAGSLGLLGVAAEAAFRVRIDPAEARMPSGLYTRPVGWGAQGANREPIPIGLVADDLAETRIPVSLDKLPEHVTAAVLAVEDQHFFEHHGFDFRRLGGALLANLRSRSISQGGSTITQQLAKNLFLSADRTPLRKLREAAMASVLETSTTSAPSCRRISTRSTWARTAAAQFRASVPQPGSTSARAPTDSRSRKQHSWRGMIHAPNRYAPQRHPEAARDRRNWSFG
ncbi:MAG: biosynthetic peptidoglycan transglycosylase [Gemmatimonadales bacterium]